MKGDYTYISGYPYSKCKELVKKALQKGLSVFLWGHPGVGKSTMANELAKEMGLPLIDIRLAQADPSEIGGILYPDREKRESVWLKPSWVPTDKPAFIFLDEMNAAVTKLHQSIAYQIVLEKRLRDWRFAEGTVVLAAGNLEEDMSIVQPLSQALSNRFVHFVLKVDVDEWLKWAKKAGIVPEIRAYINFRREKSLYNNTGDRAFPSPRSWEFASRLIEDVVEEKGVDIAYIEQLVSSAVGTPEAREFVAFFTTYRKVDIERLVVKGEIPEITESEDPSFVHALIFSLASYYSLKFREIGAQQYRNIIRFFSQKALSREYIVTFLNQLEDQALRDFVARRDGAEVLAPISKVVSSILEKRI